MGLSDNLGVDGPGRGITLDGKEYRLPKITQGQKAEFCSWHLENMRKQTMASAAEHRKMARAAWLEVTEMNERLASMPGENHQAYMALKNQIEDKAAEARSLEEEGRAMVRDLNKDISKRSYEWEGEATNDALNSVSGGYHVTWILLREKQPAITEAEVVEFYGHGKKLTQAKALHDIVQWALGFGDGGDEKKSESQPESTEKPTTNS